MSSVPRCVVVTHALTLLSSPRSRCLRSPLWCHAAILYVQVGGQDAIGEEKLQEGDSVQSVMERAVEKKRIESIDWKDVAEWQLWGSPEKVQRLHSGTRSKRLSELLPFPDESLLVLTRRPIPPTISSSSSSFAPSSSLPSSTSYSQPVLSPSRTAPVSCGV